MDISFPQKGNHKGNQTYVLPLRQMKLFSQIDEFIKKQHLNQMPWQINSYLYARKTSSGHFPLFSRLFIPAT